MQDSDKLTAYLTEYLNTNEPDIYLVSVTYKKARNPRLLIEVDTDAGVELEQCVKLNRLWRESLTESGWIDDSFDFEVGSPGVGSPLKLRRQYSKNIHRQVSVLQTNGERYDGELATVNETGVTIKYNKRVSKSSSKKEPVEKQIDWDAIKETTVLVTF